MIRVVWHKRDLRIIGNNAVMQACQYTSTKEPEEDFILPIYAYEPHLVNFGEVSQQHLAFIESSLKCLNSQYRVLDANQDGGELMEQGPLLSYSGEILDLLEGLKSRLGEFILFSNQETTHQEGYSRDVAVKNWCSKNSIEWIEVEQNGIRRGKLAKEHGVLPFNEHVKKQSFSVPLFNPKSLNILDFELVKDLAPKTRIVINEPDKLGRIQGGRKAMLEHLEKMLTPENLVQYPNKMSSPVTANEVCSKLSAYLSYGVLSDQELFHQLNEALSTQSKRLDSDEYQRYERAAQFFSERLYWRHSYLKQAEAHPDLRYQSFYPALDYDRQKHHFEPWLEAWKEGNTGVPIVDAVMRWLNHSGWINMRMRGMTTSFALVCLWLERDRVSTHLARSFLDFEPAIHHAQIAIHAGTHISDPLIYDVVKQSKTLDPEGVFIKKWIPELEKVPTQYIHEPQKMPVSFQASIGVQIGSTYPAPIIEPYPAYVAGKDRINAARAGQPILESQFWSKVLKDRAVQASQQTLF